MTEHDPADAAYSGAPESRAGVGAVEDGDAPSPAQEFELFRGRLFAMAYRLLGQVADAEDVVQDTWLAWQSVNRADVVNPRAYLTRTLTHRALNQLRSIARRREDYPGVWLPEPLANSRAAAGGTNPQDAAVLADSVSYAMLVLLDRLTARERVTLVLRDVFDVPATEVAEILGTSPAAVRTMHARARSHVRMDRGVPVPRPPREVVERFVRAIRDGDVADAMEVLAPEVRLVADGGGKARSAVRPLVGASRVLRFFLGLAQQYPDFEVRMGSCNGQDAVLVDSAGGPAVIMFGVDAADPARLGDIWVIRNPDKLSVTSGSGSGPAAAWAPRGSNPRASD
ncbi:MAG: RNA polymerase sigma factor SigJ [Austwickia sp.]|nr:RNA polymerase sigma factor SigJ [Austwickia sp.]MBK9102090.1 RNA polymerase sigma factor SigJ [Austwickia sp.]